MGVLHIFRVAPVQNLEMALFTMLLSCDGPRLWSVGRTMWSRAGRWNYKGDTLLRLSMGTLGRNEVRILCRRVCV
jgi:hypothetical protein